MAANPLVLLFSFPPLAPFTAPSPLSVSWLVRLRLASVLGLLPLIYGHGLARLSDRRRRLSSVFWAWPVLATSAVCLRGGHASTSPALLVATDHRHNVNATTRRRRRRRERKCRTNFSHTFSSVVFVASSEIVNFYMHFKSETFAFKLY